MLKQTLIAAAALATIALGTTTADAGYYGKTYYKSYASHCVTKTRAVTIRVFDDYSCEYTYRTVYRDYEVCY